MTRNEKSWIMYDVGNSAFGLVVVTAVMPIFFKEIAAAGIASPVSTAWWGYANSSASIILLILGPAMGVLADNPGWKKRLFALFLAIGTTATALLFFSGQGTWLYCLILYVIAKFGWAGSNLFYDSFLTDVAEPTRMDRVSTAGFAWGYIGSTVPFLIVIAMIFAMKSQGNKLILPELAARRGFLVVTLWWLFFSIPLIKNVRQVYSAPSTNRPFRDGFRRLAVTLGQLASYRDAFLFLLAYFFMIDAIDTVITMSVAYGVDIGLGTTTMILAILMIQVVAFPCSLLWGRFATRFRVKPLLQVGIAVYCVIILIAFFLPELQTLQAKSRVFWLLSLLVASSMGGIQALCRSFFGRLIPAEKSAEFFGFYSISGKFATIAGPLLFGITGQLTGHSRYGTLSLLVMLAFGSMLLARVREERTVG